MKKLAITMIAMLAFASAAAAQCVSMTTLGSASTEDFNTLASTGTSSTVPSGWYFLETGTNANLLYNTGSGTSTSGDTYSFGATSSAERAFGTLFSGSLASTIGGCFTNATGSAVNSLTIAYTGEQWRQGGTARFDRLDFQYSLDATSLNTGTWNDVNALDFTPPNGGAVGNTALDGNAAANRLAVTATIGGLNLATSATIWIRWMDFNALGSDDGLAVDDFSITPLVDATPAHSTTWGRVKTLYR